MLHIINKSPLENNSLDSCLRVAKGGEILLMEDAVYAATKGNSFESKLVEATKRFKIYVLQADLEARGMSDRIVPGVTPVDYGGFVDLTVNNKNCQSWL
jgi:tRNA 2-thiouridine synthesizing protein B